MKNAVIYSTKYGSVKKAAEMLKDRLFGVTLTFDVKKDTVPDLKEFDTVILGGSVYAGNVQPALKKYMGSNLEELLNKKVALFLCAGEKNPEKSMRQLENAFPADLRAAAIAMDTFGDEIDIKKVNVIEKILLKMLKGVTESYSNLSAEAIEKFAQKVNSTKTQEQK